MIQPKYTRDQKRRAVQEIVKRLAEFDGALKLIRQFDIDEQDVLEYTSTRFVNSSKYIYDPVMSTSPIGAWAVEARAKPRPGSTFDQAVEETAELRARAMEAAMSRHTQLLSRTPYIDVRS
jgi:hypothetical protein